MSAVSSSDGIIIRGTELYLWLHRENYLELSRQELVAPLSALVARIGSNGIQDLLKGVDWRIRIVGLHCLLIRRELPFLKEVLAEYFDPKFFFIRRQILMVCASLNFGAARSLVSRRLSMVVEDDSIAEYAGLLELASQLRVNGTGVFEKKLSRQIEIDGLELVDLHTSRERFRRAVQYWSEPSDTA